MFLCFQYQYHEAIIQDLSEKNMPCATANDEDDDDGDDDDDNEGDDDGDDR